MSTPSPFLSPYVSTQKKILVSNVYTPHIFCMQCSNLFQISSVPPFHVSSQILWDIIVPSPHKKMPKVHPPIFGSFHLHPLPPFWGLPCPFPFPYQNIPYHTTPNHTKPNQTKGISVLGLDRDLGFSGGDQTKTPKPQNPMDGLIWFADLYRENAEGEEILFLRQPQVNCYLDDVNCSWFLVRVVGQLRVCAGCVAQPQPYSASAWWALCESWAKIASTIMTARLL